MGVEYPIRSDPVLDLRVDTMKAWMLSIAGLICRSLGRHSAQTERSRIVANIRRKEKSWTVDISRCEGLEGRALMAVAGVAPFAVLAGQVTASNKPSQVTLQLTPGQIRADQAASVVVGFAVEAADGSSLSPRITKATGPTGTVAPLKIPNHGNSAADKLARQTHLFTKIVPSATQGEDITLNITSANKKTGGYIVEAYLAGDLNADGSVDYNDLNLLQAAYGSHVSQANYNAFADINGDGRVGCIDRTLLTVNMGAHATNSGTATAASVANAATTPIVPLTSAPTQVNLYNPVATTTTPVATTTTPVAATTIPIAIATPVTATTASAVVPVTITPTTAIPTTSTTPVYLTPVYNTTGTTGYTTGTTGYTTGTTGYTTVSGTPATIATSTGTPIYYIAQPVGTVGTATPATSAPIYLYGQPVVTGTTTTGTTTTPAATLFASTAATTTPATATPLPVYLYNSSGAVVSG